MVVFSSGAVLQTTFYPVHNDLTWYQSFVLCMPYLLKFTTGHSRSSSLKLLPILKKPYPSGRISDAAQLIAMISPPTMTLLQFFVAIPVRVTVTLICNQFVHYIFCDAHLLIIFWKSASATFATNSYGDDLSDDSYSSMPPLEPITSVSSKEVC